jgi:hypothetical protein
MKRFDMRVSLAVCFAAMIWGAVAHAESPTTYVLGVGSYSCGRFIATTSKHLPGTIMPSRDGNFVSENAEYLGWLAGFLSGFNSAHSAEQQIKIDLAGLDLWMRNWCNKHPGQRLYDGEVAFINEMLTTATVSPARDSLKKLIEKPAAK